MFCGFIKFDPKYRLLTSRLLCEFLSTKFIIETMHRRGKPMKKRCKLSAVKLEQEAKMFNQRYPRKLRSKSFDKHNKKASALPENYSGVL